MIILLLAFYSVVIIRTWLCDF